MVSLNRGFEATAIDAKISSDYPLFVLNDDYH